MNSLGMAFLHQAVEYPKGIKLLEKSSTADYPEGIAVEAMTSMKNSQGRTEEDEQRARYIDIKRE